MKFNDADIRPNAPIPVDALVGSMSQRNDVRWRGVPADIERIDGLDRRDLQEVQR